MSGKTNPTITKICIVGDPSTGKTSLHRAFVKKRFKRNYHPTIGSDFSSIEIKTKSGKSYRLAIWDLSGDEKYKQSHSTYYQGIVGLIVVFDLTDRETLMSTLDWLKSVDKIVSLNFPIILVGNKKDLPALSSRAPNDNDVRNLIIQFNESNPSKRLITYLKTSAKTGENVQEVFTHLVETMENEETNKELKLRNKNE